MLIEEGFTFLRMTPQPRAAAPFLEAHGMVVFLADLLLFSLAPSQLLKKLPRSPSTLAAITEITISVGVTTLRVRCRACQSKSIDKIKRIHWRYRG